MTITIEANVWSPEGDEMGGPGWIGDDSGLTSTEKRAYKAGMQKLASKINDPNFNYRINRKKPKGTFDYRSKGKKQIIDCEILNYNTAVLFAAMLNNINSVDLDSLDPRYRRIYKILKDPKVKRSDSLNLQFYDAFQPYINARTTLIKNKNNTLKNPKTGRIIKTTSATYKSIFGKIKLRQPINNDELQNYICENYEINTGYCVTSYLQQKLTKTQYKIIENELIINPTPTYPELTILLNSINYGLNVFITYDGEQIENQNEEYKKNINIMIHNSHMYVIKTYNGQPVKKKLKIEIIDSDNFDKLNTEIYTSSNKVIGNTKYKINNKYKKLEDILQLTSTFNINNILFYKEAEIHPVRYINKNIVNCGAFDINKCYYHILQNGIYSFGIQNGNEITTKYIKKNGIIDYGFYFVDELKNRSEIETSIFTDSKFWILGFLLNNMKDLKKRCTITYEHIPCDYKYGKKLNNIEPLETSLYSGFLAKHTYDKSISIQCHEEYEKEAYLMKLKSSYFQKGRIHMKTWTTIDDKGKIHRHNKTYTYNNNDDRLELLNNIISDDIDYETKPRIEMSSEKTKQKCGIYAYMSILQYARFQIWTIYNEVKNHFKDIQISKIYTDSIAFNKDVKEINLIKLNKKLEKSGFTVKYEYSSYKWDHTIFTPKEPTITNNKLQTYNNEKEMIKLLDADKSFSINARAGYGKSYTIKNIIIPWINKNNKKYIIATPTIESTKIYDCETMQSIICSNQSTDDYLDNKFKNINYFIIDESSFLNMNHIHILQNLKLKYNFKIILSGDANQCTYGDSLMQSNIYYGLCEYNQYTIKYHKDARYSKKYDDFLDKLLTFKHGSSKKCKEHIRSYFKVKSVNDKDDNDIKLTWTHKVGKSLGEYMTVHSAQGKTLQRYSIYQSDVMDISILYTALSRASDDSLISIYL